jgi:GNAT superfamily N-acetyltransferase
MASTDDAREHPLGPQDLPGCLELSIAAHWNQNAADWRLMLEIGRGYGLSLADGTLAASTVTLPYGAAFAWVSMVLVAPEHRRRGYATRLLRRALEDLSAERRAAVLDATPAGTTSTRQKASRHVGIQAIRASRVPIPPRIPPLPVSALWSRATGRASLRSTPKLSAPTA